MYFIGSILVAIIALPATIFACQFPDIALCGSDGKTYRTMCDWKIATLIDRELKVRDVGPCETHPLHDLYRALLEGNADHKLLRSPNSRHRGANSPFNIKFTDKSGSVADSFKLMHKIASLPFHFR